ncbi:MAG: hypothetical protein WEE89_18320 [Gemmatimonadota bacterium]
MSEAMRRVTLDWMDRRTPAPPFELERRLLRALERLPNPAATIPLTLAAAALNSLSDSVRAGNSRHAANDLLAADALLTYAHEAAAEQGTADLEELTRDFDIARFELLVRVISG